MKENIFTRLMRSAVKVEPNEIKAVLLSCSFVFTLMASYYILRPIRDAMSSNWTDAELSTLFTITFILSVIAVALYGAACSRIRIGVLVPGMYALFALSFLGFFLLIQTVPGSQPAAKAFYVWTSIFSLFHISVFWSFMADIFNKKQATRLFGFIASGSSVGAIAGPLLALVLAGSIGSENLLLLSAALLLVPMGIVIWLERIKHKELHNEEFNAETDYNQTLGKNPFSGFMLLVRNPYLLGIAIFILLYTSISTFVYFELKNLMVGLDANTRTQLWAVMDLAVNILSITTAMFGTPRLASRFGLSATLGVVPFIIVAGFLMVFISPMLWVVVCLQIVRRAGNYAVTRPGREMLYTAVDRESRFKAKSVIDIVVYRGGDMATAWAFTGLTQGLGLGISAVALIGAVIAGAWAALGCMLGRNYDRNHAVEPQRRTSG